MKVTRITNGCLLLLVSYYTVHYLSPRKEEEGKNKEGEG